ncbi:unnamed protein product [Cuscuta campestris]|uniref:Uncharacterized protein n=1 Tax=Cuscuta campestris TaxID=132261 RepID=A0A484KVE8_9ASTE|nr:unnamed protein product [Cuscuta campestris]
MRPLKIQVISPLSVAARRSYHHCKEISEVATACGQIPWYPQTKPSFRHVSDNIGSLAPPRPCLDLCSASLVLFPHDLVALPLTAAGRLTVGRRWSPLR